MLLLNRLEGCFFLGSYLDLSMVLIAIEGQEQALLKAMKTATKGQSHVKDNRLCSITFKGC